MITKTLMSMKTMNIQNWRVRAVRWPVGVLVFVTSVIGFLTCQCLAATPFSLSLKGQWPGHAREMANDLAVLGSKAYLSCGEAGLIIMDISDPSNPEFSGGYVPEWPAVALTVSEGRVYLLTQGPDIERGGIRVRLEVLEVNNPKRPIPLGRYVESVGSPSITPVGASIVLMDDGICILALNEIRVVDISDPENLRTIGRYDSGETVVDVVVSGGLAYVATQDGDLQILELRMPSSPRLIGGFDRARRSIDGGLAVDGGLVFLGGTGLAVIDVSDPTTPVAVGEYESGCFSYDVAVADDLVYVAGAEAGLVILDVSAPSDPTVVGGVAECFPSRVAVAPNYAFATDFELLPDVGFGKGFYTLDIEDPRRAAIVGGYPILAGKSEDVVVADGLAYVADGAAGVQVIDLANPERPALLSRSGYDYPGAYLHGVALEGNHVFENGFGTFLASINVSDPSHLAPKNPGLKGGIYRGDITVRDGVAFVISHATVAQEGASWRRGFYMIDVKDPARPSVLSFYENAKPGLALRAYQGLGLNGNVVYLTSIWRDGNSAPYIGFLEVVDVSDPARPTALGSFTIRRPNLDEFGSPGRMAVSGDYVYLGMTSLGSWSDAGQEAIGGVLILDVSDPLNPTRVGSFGRAVAAAGDFPKGMAVSDGRLYLAGLRRAGKSWTPGLQVMDLSNPIRPEYVGGFDTAAELSNIKIVDDLIVLAAGRDGLVILEQTVSPRVRVTGRDPFTLSVKGGVPPYQWQARPSLVGAAWEDFGEPTSETEIEVIPSEVTPEKSQFFRVISLGELDP